MTPSARTVASGTSETFPEGSPPGERLTLRQLAAVLGRHPRSIARWVDQGLPVDAIGDGRQPMLFDEARVRRWLANRDEASQQRLAPLVAARIRRETAQAAEAEQRILIRAGKLIPIDEVDRIWSAEVAALRAHLLSLPIALTDQVIRAGALEGVAGAERVLERAIHRALEELATGHHHAKLAPATPRRRAPRRHAPKARASKGRRRPAAPRGRR